MSDIDLEIPEFLRRHKGEKLAPWKPTKTKTKKVEEHPWHLPKNMDAACWAMVREAEAAKIAKKQAGLAALKAWKAANKKT